MAHEAAPVLQAARAAIPADLRARLSGSDLVQDTCTEAQKSLPQFHGQTEQEWYAYLRQILQSTLLDEIKRHRRLARDPRRESTLCHLEERVLATASAESEALRRERDQQIEAALQTLEPRKRKAIDLRTRAGYTFAQIGLAVGCSADAARKLYDRALEDLAQHTELL